MRTEAGRRHHRARVIRNRLRVIKQEFQERWGLGKRGPGSLNKDHLTNYSCFYCRPHRYRPKVRQRDWYHLLHE